MVDFQAWNMSTHPIVRLEDDWNNLMDHGLASCATYIVRKNGSYYEAIHGIDKTITYGGEDNAGGIDGTDCVAVLDAAFAAAEGVHVHLKRGTYVCDGVVTMGNNDILSGEGFNTIIDLFDASSTVDISEKIRCKIRDLKIDGSGVAKGLTVGDDGGSNAECNFTNVWWYDCTYGVYNDVTTTGMYDSVFINCRFDACTTAGVQLKELMNQFYRCMFYGNAVAVEFSSSTTGFYTKFDGCVFSTNDYDFDVGTPISISMKVDNCWFEAETNDVYKESGGADVGTKGVTFDHCYFSSTSSIDLSWTDDISWEHKFVDCTFQGWDDLTNFTLPSDSHYPKFVNSRRYSSGGTEVPLTYQTAGVAEIASGATINHNLFTTPTSVVISINNHTCNLDAIGATNFGVTIVDHAGANPGGTFYVYWIATYNPDFK